LVFTDGAFGSNFQDKIGNLVIFFPKFVNSPLLLCYSQYHKNIGGNNCFGIPLFIVDEEITRDIYLWIGLEIDLQCFYSVDEIIAGGIAFCHWQAIAIRVRDFCETARGKILHTNL
jgi:hypothetical protein